MMNNEKPFRHISEVAAAAYNERMAIANGEITFISTGFRSLNDIVYGYGKGDLIIIAARPSMGKSAFALSSAVNIAQTQIPVGIFSLEMSAEQLALRAVSLTADIPMSSLMRMNVDADNIRIPDGFAGISELPIYLDDMPGLSLANFEEKISSMISTYGVSIAFIDYLQLIDERSTRSREQEIGKISRSLKKLAKTYQIPVVALAQLNRDVDKRPDKKPMLADLRESGSIEQDADVVLLLYNPNKYGIETYPDGKPTVGTMEIIIDKQRNGETGSRRFGFEGMYTKVYELGYEEFRKPLIGEVF
jgi:replicative DNA helicase